MTSRAAPPKGVSTSDVAYRPGWFKRLYDKITGKVAIKHPWYELPKDLGLTELIGIRDTLRRENLFDTSRLPSVDPVQPRPYDKSFLTAHGGRQLERSGTPRDGDGQHAIRAQRPAELHLARQGPDDDPEPRGACDPGDVRLARARLPCAPRGRADRRIHPARPWRLHAVGGDAAARSNHAVHRRAVTALDRGGVSRRPFRRSAASSRR